jgi:MFS transporter, PPP family, 3-phenylpropionic acid transporter
MAPLAALILLFAALYAAFGVSSPFLPALMESRGMTPEQIGLLFGCATAARLISAPLAGRFADATNALRLTLALFCVATAVATLGYLAASGFWPLFSVGLLHAVALAPTTNIADAIAVSAARRHAFEYGWVRGAASTAFIAASVAAGAAVHTFGLPIIVVLQAALMMTVPFLLTTVPAVSTEPLEHKIDRQGVRLLLRSPLFQRVVLAAALVLGSHAVHDTFAVIRWTNAGISPQVASLLWSLAVAGEVFMFFLAGPWLLQRISPPMAIAVAAVVGAIRWLVSAATVDLTAVVLIQPLHGVTFALLHLACMRLLGEQVPPQLAATAQTVYGTLGVGVVTAALTIVSGWLYGALGSGAFAIMAGVCLAALPVALSIRSVTTPMARLPAQQ